MQEESLTTLDEEMPKWHVILALTPALSLQDPSRDPQRLEGEQALFEARQHSHRKLLKIRVGPAA
ncbi:MAG: hypothetical protein ABJD53_17820 [Gammaproteobacteria bacterium]